MSICNVWVVAEKALVLVDTRIKRASGEMVEASKIVLLPHANTVLTTRGVTDLLSVVFALFANEPGDFDSMEDRALSVLRTAREWLFKAGIERGFDNRPLNELEIVMVGWSPRREAMIGNTYQCIAPSIDFAKLPIDRWRIHGGDVAMGPLPEPNTPAAMESIARRQVAFFRERNPDEVIGGRLLLAELTRDLVTVTSRPDGSHIA